MLEIVIASIVLLAAFVGAAWYALLNSKERRKEALNEFDERMTAEVDEAFTAIFEEEMAQQLSDSQVPNIDSEPVISLSEQALVKPELTPRKSTVDIILDDVNEEQEPVEPQQNSKLTIIDWDMVIAFTITAAEGDQFSGLDLKVAFETLNFKFGELGIYHRMAHDARNTPLFSIANIIEPGTFEPQDVVSMTTSGILLFAKLPGPVNDLTLFDDLLQTAQSLTSILGGTLCDESRKPVNQSTFERMRSQILKLNLSMQSEQRQYRNNDYSN
ncbi:MAG: cell division protein ZipA C-terminal FtsZ-binding domain-containing protein [Methylophagaceae bacterium]